MEKYSGRDWLFYIGSVPVACLTGNPISESTETMETTTRENGGWRTSLPTMQNYTISISGVAVREGQGAMSYNGLRTLKRNRTIFDWNIREGSLLIDGGKAFITDLAFDDPADNEITFTATLQGWGKPQAQ